MERYVLRPGSMAVNHRLVTGRHDVSLSELAPRARVRIALETGDPE